MGARKIDAKPLTATQSKLGMRTTMPTRKATIQIACPAPQGAQIPAGTMVIVDGYEIPINDIQNLVVMKCLLAAKEAAPALWRIAQGIVPSLRFPRALLSEFCALYEHTFGMRLRVNTDRHWTPMGVVLAALAKDVERA